MKTSDLLIKSCIDDILPEQSVLNDYFGIDNIKDNQKIELIFGIYQGLIKHTNITANELDIALQLNKLDELIHKKSSNHKSYYYIDFCKFGIKLNKCYKSQLNNNFNQNIRNKIRTKKNLDKINFNIEGNMTEDDIIKLLHKQLNNCYICKEKVITENWEPGCLYQFSINRLDKTKPHNRDNILISCYYCNSRNHPDIIFSDKVCPDNCHIEIKNNIRKIDEINSIEINMYKIKK